MFHRLLLFLLGAHFRKLGRRQLFLLPFALLRLLGSPFELFLQGIEVLFARRFLVTPPGFAVVRLVFTLRRLLVILIARLAGFRRLAVLVLVL